MKSQILAFGLSLILTISLTSCQSQPAPNTNSAPVKGNYELADAPKIKGLIASQPNILVLDVRTPEEYKDGHLPNAVNVDFNGDQFDKQILALDKSQPVIVYCQAGGRSKKATDFMMGSGFKQVYELAGGYNNWNP